MNILFVLLAGSMVVHFGVFDVASVQVIVKLQENFASLSVEQFLKLYKAFLIWPTWVSCLSHVYCTGRIGQKGLCVCMLNQSPPLCLSPLDLCPNATLYHLKHITAREEHNN